MTLKITFIFTRKKIQKRNKEKEDKGINICYYHRADFWTTESGADYCRSSGCFNCQTWSVRSEFCLQFYFYFLFF